jgi:hypothetical protein
MRFLVLALAAIIAALTPAAVLAHGGSNVSVTGDVRANGPIAITGADFDANDAVRLELRKEGVPPIALGDVAADADGGFTITIHLPASVTPGIYELAAEGADSASAEVTVFPATAGETAPPSIEPAASVSSDRSTGEAIGLAGLTAALALVGAGLLWLSRTHRANQRKVAPKS